VRGRASKRQLRLVVEWIYQSMPDEPRYDRQTTTTTLIKCSN